MTNQTTDPRGSRFRPLAGVRAGDAVLAAALTLGGAALMYGNLAATPEDVAKELAAGHLTHATDQASWLLIPTFSLVTLPILWWRRGVLPVALVTLAATVAHVLAFGWITRCGAALPLAFGLAYLGTLQERRWRAPAAVVTASAVIAVVLSRDATTGWTPWPLCFALVAVAVALGWLARRRNDAIAQLEARTVELQRVRDERAALEVADDRARVSRQVDDVLSARLAGLAALAEGVRGRQDDEVRAALEAIEEQSRQALDDTREVVGVLRGDAVELAPPSSMDQLEDRLRRVGQVA